ncbi:MAG: glycosyltransferase [Chloroflexi bacterium]|nr:glycosyltransferase [Chloroflexota bacterium]
MKIALVSVHGCPQLPPGGREVGGMNIYVDALSRELGRRGHQVDIFTRTHDADEPQIAAPAANVRVIHLDAGPRGPVVKEELYPLLSAFLYNLETFAGADGGGYDVIFSHYWLSGWVGGYLRRGWRAPHITMFHTMGAIKNQALPGEGESNQRVAAERRIVAQADRIIAPSPQERRAAMQLYAAPAGRVEVIPCGVDLERFSPGDRRMARRSLGLGDERLLLFVGRLEPLKGLDILVGALPLLQEAAPTRLLVVGGDAQSEREFRRIQRQAGELGVTDQITFAGSVPHDALPAYYRAADVCVAPSYYESFGMAAVEAMACGIPVVAARAGGLQSTVRHGETGYLIPWRCPEAYVERLEPLLASDAMRDHFGRAGRAAAQQFGWPAVADRTLALFENLIRQQERTAMLAGAGAGAGAGFGCWAV